MPSWCATGPVGTNRAADCASPTTSLLPLPPYAPELNPMENIWDYLRGNKLSKRVWNSYQEIVAACKDAWLFLLGDPKRIDTIAHRAWSWVNV